MISKDFQLYLERKITFQILNSLKKILITGESGFIGSHVIDFFVNKYPQYEIHGLDILTYASNRDFTKKLELKSNYFFHKINICDYTLLLELFEQYKFTDVIHLAAESHVDNSISDPTLFAKTNVLGTLNLLESFRYHSSGRFHHVSTDEVYGESMLSLEENMKTERSLLCPTNPYAATKAGAELIAQSYYHSYKMPIIITRGNNVYGPNQYPEKLIPKFIMHLLNNEKVTIQGDGSCVRAFLHSHDVARAFELILEKGKIGEIYNIGSDEDSEYSVLDVAKLLIRLLKNNQNYDNWIRYIEDRPFNDKRYYISNQKMKDLGWDIKISFDEGIKSLICSIDNSINVKN